MEAIHKMPSTATCAFQAIGNIGDSTDVLNKAIKVIIPVAEIAMISLGLAGVGEGVRAGLGLLKGRLSDAKSVINASNIFGRIGEWANDKARNKILISLAKIINRVALTIAHAMEFAGFIDKSTLRNFSRAEVSVGPVPIFEIVKSSILLISSTFGIVHSASEIKDAKTVQEKLRENDDVLSRKFANLAHDEKYGSSNVKNAYLGKYLEKRSKLNPGDKKIEKYTTYIKDLEKPTIGAKKILAYKLEKQRVKEHNAANTIKKGWIAVCVEVTKIAAITLGLLSLGLAVIFPVLSTPAAILGLTAINLTAATFGLSKNLFDIFNGHVDKPKYADCGPKEKPATPPNVAETGGVEGENVVSSQPKVEEVDSDSDLSASSSSGEDS